MGEAPRADREAARHPEPDRQRVAREGLQQGVAESGQRLAQRRAERVRHRGRRGHEERVRQPGAHRDLPDHQQRGQGGGLTAEDA